MTPWLTRFRTMRPLEAFPRLELISAEIQRDAGYHWRGRDRLAERHLLFKYTLGGEGRFADAAGEHVLRRGQGFLCLIDDPATSYFYPDGAVEPWRFVYVIFTGDWAREMVRQMTARHGALYELPREGDLVRRILGYAAMDGRDVPISAAEGARFVVELLTELAASCEPPPELDPAGQLVRRAMDLVRHHLDRPLNAAELAEMLGVSREHLARCFRRQTGQSPYQYILRRKMLLACRLLKGETLGVKQVAAAAGFVDPAHFNRAFRSVLAMTPLEFRVRGIVPADL